MSKKFNPTNLIISILLFIISCSPPPVIETEQSWAERTLQELSLREKISQMLIYRLNLKFRNTEDKEWKEILKLVETDGIGGIHLWNGNAGMSLALLNELQCKSKVPILVDMDIEKGIEQRFPEGTQIPPAMAIAASNYLANAYEAGLIVAKEGRSVGIHWNLAPVVDINNNPDNPIINTRSYSDDPQMVSNFAVAYIKGLHAGNMLATAKHFPGHGDTQTDSHISLATIPSDSSRLWSLELSPYKSVIDAGVDAIMVSHLISPDYQPDSYTPATLSKFWIQDILRGKLGFDGVIVTDAFDMGALTNSFSDDYVLIRAVNAGCDMIIQNDDYKKAIDVIENAVNNGIIPLSRINESALRMLALKEKAGLNHSKMVNLKEMQTSLGLLEFNTVAEKIAHQSIVIVKNDGNLMPLKSFTDTINVIDIYGNPYNHQLSVASKELIKNRIPVRTFAVDESDNSEYLKTIIDKIDQDDYIVLNIFIKPNSFKGRIGFKDNQIKFIDNLINKSKNIFMVSYGNPYIISEFSEIPVYICAWEEQSSLQEAAANAVIGNGNYNGKLPIDIPGIAMRGDGIQLKSDFRPLKSNWKPPAKTIKMVMPYEVNANLDQLKIMVNKAVEDSAFPGGILLASKNGKVFIDKPFGYYTYAKEIHMTEGSIFDLASITKVVATTSAIMKLFDEGKLKLDDKVGKYIPEFIDNNLKDCENRKTITLRNLLTHTAGLPPFKLYYKIESNSEDRFKSVYSTELESKPGEKCVYSDIGFILLGKIVERISREPLNEFVKKEIFDPLGMSDTFYNPYKSKFKRIVPTEYNEEERGYIKGHVHDENAYSFGGVSGHAGLFSTTHDLAIFAQMLLNGGTYDKVKIFNPNTVKLFTSTVDTSFNSRYLGWEKPVGDASGGVYLSDNSFGHTGFTGTSIWIDPKNDIFVILLTNAVNPHREWKSPKYFDWRQRIHSAVYEALGFTEMNPNLKWRRDW